MQNLNVIKIVSLKMTLGPVFDPCCAAKFVSFFVLTKKRELFALLLLCYWCLVPWVSVQDIVVVFSSQTHLLCNAI